MTLCYQSKYIKTNKLTVPRGTYSTRFFPTLFKINKQHIKKKFRCTNLELAAQYSINNQLIGMKLRYRFKFIKNVR